MTIYSQIPLRDLQRLRVVVKNNHMKHYPKDKVTDKEADRIIESISPQDGHIAPAMNLYPFI